MIIHKLTQGRVNKITTDGMYNDGGGLNLKVTNGGAGKSWVFRFTDPNTKQEKQMGLGSLATFSLDDARDEALRLRKMVATGKSPLDERKADKLERAIAAGRVKTVNEVLDEYIDTFIAHRSASYQKATRVHLNKYVRNTIGEMPIEKVTTDILLNNVGLRQLWRDKPVTGQMVQIHLNKMFKGAITKRYYHGNNPAAWRGNLDSVLPNVSDVHHVKHHENLPHEKLGSFLQVLRSYEDRRKNGIRTNIPLMIEFGILTGSRPKEVRLATWSEMDIDNMVW